jgi:hypothetical protein
MGRDDTRQLSKELTGSGFDFLPKGNIALEDVYKAVKAAYPALCDDGYLCAESCGTKQRKPEWQHRVRTVLSRLKKLRRGVTNADARGHWRFF